MSLPIGTDAPAKINVCLLLGPTRPDGRHELVTVFQPLRLADRVVLTDSSGAADEVVCPGVEGPNLAAQAVDAFREALSWDGPAVRIEITKAIPVAGGMAGGSADAAAALRLLCAHAGVGDDALLRAIGATLGADVAAQVEPRRWLGRGAGESLTPLPDVEDYGVLVVPDSEGLPTPAVFAEADRLGLGRSPQELAARAAAIAAQPELPSAALVNDLQPAALSLRPRLARTLEAVREAGAAVAMLSGSGPTVLGFFADPEAAAAAADRVPGARATATRPRPSGPPVGPVRHNGTRL